MYPPEMKDRFERIMSYMLEHYSEKKLLWAISVIRSISAIIICLSFLKFFFENIP